MHHQPKFFRLLAAFALIVVAGAAYAEVIQLPAYQVPKQEPKKDDTAEKVQSAAQLLKGYQSLFGGEKNHQKQIEMDYEKMKNDPTTPNPRGDFTPAAATSGPFATTAEECGEKSQRANQPKGGRTMCGLAVAQMVQCMSRSIGGESGCSGSCGHGKMFVGCNNGQMAKCGYAKIPPTDDRCKQPGAVLAYTKSPTERGQEFGHVEFVCGLNKYCSIYKSAHERPWPKAPADSCWFPKESAGNKGGGK